MRGKREAKCTIITCYLSDRDLQVINILISKDRGRYPSRSECIRHAVSQWVNKELEALHRVEKVISTDPDKIIIDGKEIRIIGEA